MQQIQQIINEIKKGNSVELPKQIVEEAYNTFDFPNLDTDIELFKLKETIQTYTWVCPTDYNHSTILNVLENSKKILDVGCGSGYWIKAIKNIFPEKEIKGIRLNCYGVDNNTIEGTEDLIEEIDFNDFIKENEMDFDTILLFWPPYSTPMGYDVLKHFKDNKNIKRIIYIGEGEGGCNADDDFFKLLDEMKEQEEIKVIYKDLDTFNFLHDHMRIIEKT